MTAVPPMTSPTVSRAVVAELSLRYRSQLPDDEIESCINAAADDLRRSVSVDSLPEMAIRVAVVRLYRKFGIVPAHYSALLEGAGAGPTKHQAARTGDSGVAGVYSRTDRVHSASDPGAENHRSGPRRR